MSISANVQVFVNTAAAFYGKENARAVEIKAMLASWTPAIEERMHAAGVAKHATEAPYAEDVYRVQCDMFAEFVNATHASIVDEAKAVTTTHVDALETPYNELQREATKRKVGWTGPLTGEHFAKVVAATGAVNKNQHFSKGLCNVWIKFTDLCVSLEYRQRGKRGGAVAESPKDKAAEAAAANSQELVQPTTSWQEALRQQKPDPMTVLAFIVTDMGLDVQLAIAALKLDIDPNAPVKSEEEVQELLAAFGNS
jgi:hypothetical protein